MLRNNYDQVDNIDTQLEQVDQTISTGENLAKFSETIESSSKYMYEIVKNTDLWKQILAINGRDEARLEKMSKSIDSAIKQFLLTDLDFLDAKILDNISISIQISLIESLKNWEWDFFEQFANINTKATKNWKVKTKWFWKMVNGLFKSFSIWWSYLGLLKNINNFKLYIGQNSSKIWKGEKLKLFQNPFSIKEVYSNPIRANDIETLGTYSFEQLWLNIDATNNSDNTTKLTQTINDLGIKITPKLINSIEQSAINANKILEQRTTLKRGLSGNLWMLDSMFESLHKTIGSFVDIPTLEDLLTSDNKILNLIFSLLGFSGWLKWLRKDYNKENIKNWLSQVPTRKEFISSVFTKYDENKNNEITEDTFDKVQKLSSLKVDKLNPTDLELKNKIPKNYWAMKTAFMDSLDNPSVLNPSVIQKYQLWQFITASEIEEKEDKKSGKKYQIYKSITISDKEKFTDAYLQQIIPELVWNSKFINTITSKEQFLYAMTWNLVLDKFFVDWVRLWIENPNSFENQENNNGWNLDAQEALKFDGSTLILESQIPWNTPEAKAAFKNKVIAISQALWINPNHLMVVMNAESWLQYDIQNQSWGSAHGLIQFMPKTLELLGSSTEQLKNMTAVQQLDLVKQHYTSYKDKNINTLENLYLATFFPVALWKEDSYVFETSELKKDVVAQWNPWIDWNHNNEITMAEFKDYVNWSNVLWKALSAST